MPSGVTTRLHRASASSQWQLDRMAPYPAHAGSSGGRRLPSRSRPDPSICHIPHLALAELAGDHLPAAVGLPRLDLAHVAVLLGNRGSRRTSGLRHRLELRRSSMVRMVPDSLVDHGSSGGRSLRHGQLAPGHAVDLGWVLLRQDRAVQVRVVGVWAPGHCELW